MNPHIKELDVDYYYHLGLDSSMNIKEMFGDTKIVLMGGSAKRMEQMANNVADAFPTFAPKFGTKVAAIGKTERYSIFKLGPIVTVSHGMGNPSIGILLHELAKLFKASGADPVFLRMGTCGGLGVPVGTVVVTDVAYNGMLEPSFNLPILGKMVKRSTVLDKKLCQEILKSKPDGVNSVVASTMCANCFYEGQGRLDGALCDYDLKDKMEFLKVMHAKGIRNIEMESLGFAGFCNAAGIRGAVMAVTLLDRLNGDQVHGDLSIHSINLMKYVLYFVAALLGLDKPDWPKKK